jgi:hypothetical protein
MEIESTKIAPGELTGRQTIVHRRQDPPFAEAKARYVKDY